MSRYLLHKTKLEEFKAYLTEHNFSHRPGKGDYEVLQVQINEGKWQCVFRRDVMPEHFTVAYPLENVVRQFINSTKRQKQ